MTSRVRKTLLISTCLLLAVAFALMGYYFLAVTNFKAYPSSLSVDEEAFLLKTEEESIGILQLSDVQTSNLVESAIAYPMLKRVVERARPDLIVLTGDNISNGSGKAVLNTFISLMDSFEIPWAPVFGNHDIRSAVAPEEICRAYEESEYCLFGRGDVEDRYGNYYYTVERCGEPVWSLIFMDSADSGFTEEQVAWYGDTVGSVTREAGKAVPSAVFFHIPIFETSAAHESYALDPTLGTGVQASEVRTQEQNGFFESVLAHGSTKALFYGHDHENNTRITYRGVLFCYATKTGRTVYYRPDSLGANLITLRPDSTLTVETVDGR